ncbi:sulfotransferase [Octadecabacter sp. CECT 8868]|uniref:sulfotransferase domain-containing protein n=1 Tax=Octadecabacter algicola TaxID=2909342 RepID=UPI001F25958D|nr:sulfotransferase domain-containing protein [Octadecabacter algicola]MCF2904185.1 sulfotransferase [Octadecabacter algicola]
MTPVTKTDARFLCVGTHHKTGTIWMRKVLRAISNDQNVPFMQCYRAKKLAEAAETGPQIIVNWSSSFPQQLLEMGHARFIHIIRDPRDVLLSGMRYHRIAPLGNEKFLREKRDEWGGKNYQDHLNALPDDHARLMFEMENKHDKTVQEMLNWPYEYGVPNDRVADIKYEDLIEDTDCAIFRGMLEECDIDGIDIDKAVQSYWDRSLFGGLAMKDDREDRVALHVSSGKKAQWVTKLPREIAEPYAERYADALKTLGYAENSDWVKDCLPAKEIAA